MKDIITVSALFIFSNQEANIKIAWNDVFIHQVGQNTAKEPTHLRVRLSLV